MSKWLTEITAKPENELVAKTYNNKNLKMSE